MLNLLSLKLLNFATFLWLAFWALRAFRCLAIGSRHSILFVILVHFLFSGVPLLLDVLFGKPAYLEMPGFYLATRDNTTSIIYCLYVSAAPVIWWWTRRESSKDSDINIDNTSLLQSMKPVLHLILLMFLLSPLIAWLYSPDPQAYQNYGVAPQGLFKFDKEEEYHNLIVTPSCLISLVGATGFLALQKRIKILSLIFLLPWIILVFWLNGKRHTVVFAIVLLGYVFWQKGYLKGKRFVAASILAVLIILSFSYIYKAQIRNKSIETVDIVEFYDDIRIDYGRDAEIKMAIFAELYPNKIQILDYRGQSLLYYLAIYVPRETWPQKPMPYAQYVTSAGLMRPPKMWGWAVTTSCLDEAIANFSWSGMILGPLVLSLICGLGDARKNVLVSPLTVLVASLFLTVHLVAFWSLFFFWLMTIALIRPVKRRNL